MEGIQSCGGSGVPAPNVDHLVAAEDLDGHDPRPPLALRVDDLALYLCIAEAIAGRSSLGRVQHAAVEEDSWGIHAEMAIEVVHYAVPVNLSVTERDETDYNRDRAKVDEYRRQVLEEAGHGSAECFDDHLDRGQVHRERDGSLDDAWVVDRRP